MSSISMSWLFNVMYLQYDCDMNIDMFYRYWVIGILQMNSIGAIPCGWIVNANSIYV